MDAYAWMVWPALACLVLTGIHSYLGIHVLERKVVFVDLALAQVSALGYAAAYLRGHEIASTDAYFYSLGFTLAGAALFALSRPVSETPARGAAERRSGLRLTRQLHEPFIGAIYVVSAAAGILLIDQSPHGAEHIKELLQGSIVWVRPRDVAITAALYGVIGVVHYLCRRPFTEITLDPETARARGRNILAWDFLFYATFGLVVTSSVQIAGVLLVFTFLIIPALIAAMFVESIRARLILGWLIGFAVSIAGLALSYDRPSGPMIIALMGLALLFVAAMKQLVDRARVD